MNRERDAMKTEELDTPAFTERLRRKDPEALRYVVHTLMGQVHRAAIGAGLSHEQAEEATQETFVSFFEAAPRFEGRSKVRTFIFTILYRQIGRLRRGWDRERKTDEIEGVLESRFDENGHWVRPPRSADDRLFDKEIVDKLEECLESAPDRQRLAFLLKDGWGFSTQEVCNSLAVSGTNLGVMLFRVRNRLRECLEHKGIFGASS